jgi:hypothetical protein
MTEFPAAVIQLLLFAAAVVRSKGQGSASKLDLLLCVVVVGLPHQLVQKDDSVTVKAERVESKVGGFFQGPSPGIRAAIHMHAFSSITGCFQHAQQEDVLGRQSSLTAFEVLFMIITDAIYHLDPT